MRTPPDNDRGRPGEKAASNVISSDTLSLPQRIDNFLQDALTEIMLTAERAWWLRRAEDFERAKPVPGEYVGGASHADLRAQWLRLDRMARACRARASVSPFEDIREDVAAVLEDVAA